MNIPRDFGEMRRWTGGDTFIVLRGDPRQVHELEIKTGALLWMPAEGGILYDTIMTDFIDPRVMSNSVGDGWVTREQYRIAVREKRIRDCPANAPTIVTEPNAPAHLAPLLKLGVRFF